MENNIIYIIGCGGQARSVADVLLSQNKKSIIFVDENGQPGEKVLGFPVLTTLPKGEISVHVASGNNKVRSAYEKLNNLSVIAADAYVSESCHIGTGSFIAHNAFCAVETQIGQGCIINTGAIIEHQVSIGDYTHVAPNSTICGKCKIGKFVLVGAGTTIKPDITVCDNIIIGSGSVVVSDLTEPGIYYGVPAKLCNK